MTKREQIIAHVAAVLSSPTLSGVPVYRSRISALNPFNADGALVQPLSILVAPETDKRGEIQNLQTERMLFLNIAVLSVGDVADSLADPVVEEIFRRLSTDTSLGGLCKKIREEETHFDFVQMGMDNCLVTLKFAIAYTHNTLDLSKE